MVSAARFPFTVYVIESATAAPATLPPPPQPQPFLTPPPRPPPTPPDQNTTLTPLVGHVYTAARIPGMI